MRRRSATTLAGTYARWLGSLKLFLIVTPFIIMRSKARRSSDYGIQLTVRMHSRILTGVGSVAEVRSAWGLFDAPTDTRSAPVGTSARTGLTA